MKKRKHAEWDNALKLGEALTQLPENTNYDVADFLPPSPIHLALLAAVLDPKLSGWDHEKAFFEAVKFYLRALLFWSDLSGFSAQEFLEFEWDRDDLWHEMSSKRSRARRQKEEKEGLRLYPHRYEPDGVRDFLGVSVKTALKNVRDYLLFDALREGFKGSAAKERVEELVNYRKRRTEDGELFDLFQPSLLKTIRDWKRRKKQAGGVKAAATAKRLRRTS